MKAPRITARLCIEIVISDADTIAEKPKESKALMRTWTDHRRNPTPVIWWKDREGREQWVALHNYRTCSQRQRRDNMDAAPATAEFKPPFEWVHHLYGQAIEVGFKGYMKTSLLGERVREYAI
jgi:hypothetical protein